MLSVPQIPLSEGYLYPDDSNQFRATTSHMERLSTTFFLFILNQPIPPPPFTSNIWHSAFPWLIYL